jgi:hypothetical protein
MIMDPFGTSLLVGMASGGIRRLQISSYLGGPPKLVEVSGGLAPAALQPGKWTACHM